MKSLAELEAIKNKVNAADNNGKTIKVLVGLATCGIAAGARPVLDAINKEVEKKGLQNVKVSQTGCIGVCRLEPLVEVYVPGEKKVTYVKVQPDMAYKIVTEHLEKGNVVEEYTIGYYEKNNN